MLLKELTPADLQNIANDIHWVREHWVRIPNTAPYSFDGGMDNLIAIAHVAYEHLDDYFKNEPQAGYRKFAVVFGNILVHQLGFQWLWGIENKSRLCLRHPSRTEPIDIVRLVRNESERDRWRCPDFNSLYSRIEGALTHNIAFPLDQQALISLQTSPPTDISPPPQSNH